MNIEKPPYLIFVDDSYILDYKLGNVEGDKKVYTEEGVVPLKYDRNNLPAYCAQFKDKKPKNWQLYVYDDAYQKYIIPGPSSVNDLIERTNSAIMNLFDYLGAKLVKVSSIECEKTNQTNSTEVGGGGGGNTKVFKGEVSGRYSSKTSDDMEKKIISQLSMEKTEGKLQPLENIKAFARKFNLIRYPFFQQQIYKLENHGIIPSGTITFEFTYFESYNKAIDTATNLEGKVSAFSIGAKINNSESYNKEIEKTVKIEVTF